MNRTVSWWRYGAQQRLATASFHWAERKRMSLDDPGLSPMIRWIPDFLLYPMLYPKQSCKYKVIKNHITM